MSYINFTPVQIDALKEIGNIGAGNAATALSQLINKKVDMSVPSLNIVPFDELLSKVNAEKIVIGVLVRVLGDTPGNILFIFQKKTAIDIIENIIGERSEKITEMGNSVLCEVGNIISSSYMNAISKFTNLVITPSVPVVTTDMLGAMLSTIYVESMQYDEYVLDIETVFLKDGSDNKSIGGHFYYIPVPGSLEKMLNSLGLN